MVVGGLTMPREWLARAILAALAGLAVLAVILGWRALQGRTVLHARMPEGGGWDPAAISARVGEPLRLRLTSDDVTHSFAVGQMDRPPVDIHPGEVSEVTLTFDRPGKYVFYCTRWCGPNHWRMRGVIEVTSAGGSLAELSPTQKTPLYVDLNLDIDAPHPASTTPQARPSAAAGEFFLEIAPPIYRSPEYLRRHSPAQTWQALRGEPSTQGLSDQQVWALVAALWKADSSPERLAQGYELYTQNCAACHGENGAGDGVFASQMTSQEETADSPEAGHNLQSPADFTDSGAMLGASPALLEGKIVRGGMGSGMPYWGPIFSDDQVRAIVEYLYTFQFDYKLGITHAR
jgi:mono/diheme cytochrome c family protein/plastocyanin